MLLTKLHLPSPGKGLLKRTEQLEKLDGILERKLLLVSAPAGFGKTTLVSEWIHRKEISASWYSLDSADNDPGKFLEYLISGIQQTFPGFGDKALTLLKSSQKLSPEAQLSLIVNEAVQIHDDYLMVLDDYHCIEHAEIHELVSLLIDRLPPNFHVALITRSDPSFPLSRLRSQNKMLEIRASDLSFEAREISDLFNKHLKISINQEDASTLQKKTEGWVSGLQLTAMSLHGKSDPSSFIKHLSGDSRFIMDYLIEEVLQQQTEEVREFLLKTSILDKFNASLCDYVLERNGSLLVLEQLEKSNLFLVALDSDRQWYRYHHLFSELLLHKLQISEAELIQTLQLRAGQWFATRGMIEEAIKLSLKAKDYETALAMIGEIVHDLWAKGRHSTLLSFGETIPDTLIYDHPEFSLYYAWILINSGAAPKAGPFLQHAEEIVEQRLLELRDDDEALQDIHLLKGKVAVARASFCTMTGCFDQIEKHSSIALEHLPEEEPLWYSWGWFSVALKDMALNRLPEAIESLNRALDYGKRSGNIYLVSTIALRLSFCEQRMGRYVASYENCRALLDYMQEEGYGELTEVDWIFSGLYTTLATIHHMWGEYEEALENIQIGYRLSLKESNIMYQFLGLFTLSFVYHGLNNWDKSLEKLAELDKLKKEHTLPPQVTILYISWKGFVLLETESIEAVYRFFHEHDIGEDTEITLLNEHAFIPYVHLQIREGKLDHAESILKKIDALAHLANKLERIIEIQVIYSIIHYQRGDMNKAVECMILSMEVAWKEKIVMYFIYYMEQFREVLEQAFRVLATKNTSIPDEFVAKIKHIISHRDKVQKAGQKSEISKRELETLKLLAQELSNQEIADRLFISVQTVKSHVKSILLKLEVENRYKAAKKARETGLV